MRANEVEPSTTSSRGGGADDRAHARRRRRRPRGDAGRDPAAVLRRSRCDGEAACSSTRSYARSATRPRSTTRAASRSGRSASRRARGAVRVEARDETGEPVSLELEGADARVVQHELDHLDGALIIDRTDAGARREALGQLRPRLVLGLRARMARIAVAATAPFGADVLERLAARHDVAALLTRPDAPAGRGGGRRPPPAKVVAERLGIPVLQPERPDAGARTRRAHRRRLRVRAARPRAPAGARLAERPPVAPSPLARGGAGRAGHHGRRRRDGRHDPRDGVGARRGPVAAQEAFRSGRTTMPGPSTRARRRWRRVCSTTCSTAPAGFVPQTGEATYADKIGPPTVGSTLATGR